MEIHGASTLVGEAVLIAKWEMKEFNDEIAKEDAMKIVSFLKESIPWVTLDEIRKLLK